MSVRILLNTNFMWEEERADGITSEREREREREREDSSTTVAACNNKLREKNGREKRLKIPDIQARGDASSVESNFMLSIFTSPFLILPSDCISFPPLFFFFFSLLHHWVSFLCSQRIFSIPLPRDTSLPQLIFMLCPFLNLGSRLKLTEA